MSLPSQLTDLIQSRMASLRVPGVAVGVLHGDAVHTAGFGVTNVEHPLPVDTRTLFQVGSITKTLTGTLILRLVEQGRLDLDVPLRTYLPDLKLADEAVAARVTLRHVLTHTGGWVGDYFDDSGPGDDALARMVARLDRLPQLCPLGELWSYNNAGFYLAGRVIEVATGQPYEAAARELVLEPLGMTHSFFFAAEAITHRVAAGHEPVYTAEAAPAVARPWGLARCGNPVGGLVSCIDDMLEYARFHLGLLGADLVRPEALEQMHTPLVPAANGEWMALTWHVREAEGVRLLRHGGATNGQAATLWLAPAQRFAIVVLTNSDRGGELHQALVNQALEHDLGVTLGTPEPQPASPAQLEPYLGRYTAAAADRVLYLEGDTLMVQVEDKGGFPTADSPPSENPPPVRAALCGHDQLLLLDEPMQGNRGEFLRDEHGNIAWLRISGRLHRRI